MVGDGVVNELDGKLPPLAVELNAKLPVLFGWVLNVVFVVGVGVKEPSIEAPALMYESRLASLPKVKAN